VSRYGDDVFGMQSEDEAALGLETAPPEFYDPAADDRDEKWAVKQRQVRFARGWE